MSSELLRLHLTFNILRTIFVENDTREEEEKKKLRLTSSNLGS